MPPPSLPQADRTLGWYAGFVRRHLAVLACGLALGIGVSAGLVARAAPEYVATAHVVLSVLPSGPDDRARSPVSIDSDAQLATSAGVLQAAAAAVDHPGGAAALQRQVEVGAVPTSRVLLISVSGPDPTVAYEATSAVSEAFLVARRSIIENRLDASRAATEAQIADISGRLAALPAAGLDGHLLAPALGIERGLFADLNRLQQDLVGLIAERPDPGFVSEPPRLPHSPVRTSAPMTVVSGALLGLLAGATAGWLRDGLAALRARRSVASWTSASDTV